MSSFSIEQMTQLGKALRAADWGEEDVRRLGQAGKAKLAEIKMSLMPQSDIIAAIEGGKTELWLAPGQSSQWVGGQKILAHLTETGLLAGCADRQELLAIQAKGIDFFRKHFRGKVVFGWRGVRGGSVPFLVGLGGKVVLHEHRLGRSWYAGNPALRRK